MNTEEFPSRYDASQIEEGWYARWESEGAFLPSPDPSKPVFSITIPPPNITGSLHMGHALCYPLQDMLGRYYRMKGCRVLILPGQDHAGIATQVVVGKQLKAQGILPHQIGREKFIEKVWEWRKESGDTILRQFRALGCAFDWSRTRFTLDDAYAEAVLKVFIDWHDRGLIYRGLRVVNWDPVLETTVSDIETERKDTRGKLYHIRYPFADGTGEVVIATTRPETMLADVAVAVHPSDKRYEGLVGKELILPLVGRRIPLIADIYPDPEFGTGAVKITPGHDANDFEVGQRHGLETLIVLDSKAKVNCLGGAYEGLDRSAARKKVVADLEEQGYLVKVEDHALALMISQRSGEPIEPMASEQWFARQRELADSVIEAIESGKIKFVPERFTGIALDWLKNIRDWNISRQLWWGHRIPVYYTEDGTPFAAMSWEDAQAKAGDRKIVRQDTDVLDTWFSSGLWPFATLGWPEKTDDLAAFYPTSVLVTARDIIYLWVARMIMMGIDFVKEIPFHEVMIYATVFNEEGRRMSKSLGTGIDPMDVITTKGADSLRWALLSQTGDNQDIRYSDKRSDDARSFCNKIWNAARFVLMNVEAEGPEKPAELDLIDQWLLSRLNHTIEQATLAYDSRNIQAVCTRLYQFFWSEVCDWYIEISKSRLAKPETRQAPQWVLVQCLSSFLKLLHPIMPFISEELYHKLPGRQNAGFLAHEPWPLASEEFSFPEVEQRVEKWFAAVRAFRNLRAEAGVSPMKPVPAAFIEGSLDGGEAVFLSQAWAAELRPGKPSGAHISASVGSLELHLETGGLVDAAKEAERIGKDLEKKRAELAKLQARLENQEFLGKAKPEVIASAQSSASDLAAEVARMEARLSQFSQS